MSPVYQWAVDWCIPIHVVHDLLQRIGTLPPNPTSLVTDQRSEAYAQSQVRLEASEKGLRLFRNNVGALRDETGRMVRYGLANDSAKFNAQMKSSDLIGIRPVLIMQAHVGWTIGQFVSREVKRPGWTYSDSDRERAQLAWIKLVTQMGGDAAFTTGRGSL